MLPLVDGSQDSKQCRRKAKAAPLPQTLMFQVLSKKSLRSVHSVIFSCRDHITIKRQLIYRWRIFWRENTVICLKRWVVEPKHNKVKKQAREAMTYSWIHCQWICRKNSRWVHQVIRKTIQVLKRLLSNSYLLNKVKHKLKWWNLEMSKKRALNTILILEQKTRLLTR